MLITVGSTNPCKLDAVRQAFEEAFSSDETLQVTVQGYDVSVRFMIYDFIAVVIACAKCNSPILFTLERSQGLETNPLGTTRLN
jgi:non-canonical (house-cleaning) NTP pyrophosphatase